MKALSLTQPSATLVAIGAKRVETRSWGTKYRGPIAIHAAKGFPRACRELCNSQDFVTALYPEFGFKGVGIRTEALPRGAILAVARLVDCVSTNHFAKGAKNFYPELATPTELRFGDYSQDRFAWILAEVRSLEEPIPARGALGLWEWDLLGELADHTLRRLYQSR